MRAMPIKGVNVQSPGIELDLRGVRVEEGLEQVEKYLDNAYMARLPWVRIIHGKGTGALRDAIRESLKEPSLCRRISRRRTWRGGRRRYSSKTDGTKVIGD